MSTNPLPPELVARWLPDWRRLAQTALNAARQAREEPVALVMEMDRTSAWGCPFGQRRDQAVQALFLAVSRAFCLQGTQEMRATLADVLLEAALAFLARLERAAARLEAEAPAPVIPLRRPRRDIDDMPDYFSDGGGGE